MSNLAIIDKPVVIILANYLDLQSIVKCSKVCKLWNRWFNLNQVWKIVCYRWFPEIVILQQTSYNNWKSVFKFERLSQRKQLLEYETRKINTHKLTIPYYLRPEYIIPDLPPIEQPDIDMKQTVIKTRRKKRQIKRKIINQKYHS